MKLADLRGILIIASVHVVLGCSSAPDVAISDRYENVDYEKSGVDLSDYRNVMFGALEVNLSEQAQSPDRANEQRLRREFRNALFLELQKSTTGLNNRFVDRPGRDTLLVKPRLMGSRNVTPGSSAMKTDAATDLVQVDSSLTLQISLLDSLSGELLLRAAGTQSQSRLTESDDVDWIEVGVMADAWAKSLVAFLDEHLSK